MVIKERPDQESVPFEPIYNAEFYEAMERYPDLKPYQVRRLIGLPPLKWSPGLPQKIGSSPSLVV